MGQLLFDHAYYYQQRVPTERRCKCCFFFTSIIIDGNSVPVHALAEIKAIIEEMSSVILVPPFIAVSVLRD